MNTKAASEGQKNEGRVKDIIGKGGLTAREVKEELWKRNVSFVRSYDRAFSGLFLALAFLWLLPAIAEWTGWGFLSFFARLPRVDFPIAVIIIGAGLIFVSTSHKYCSVKFSLPAISKVLTGPALLMTARAEISISSPSRSIISPDARPADIVIRLAGLSVHTVPPLRLTTSASDSAICTLPSGAIPILRKLFVAFEETYLNQLEAGYS